MYFAMLLVLFALFFRPVGFDYRRQAARIRAGARPGTGDSFVGSFVPALVFGVAFGNLLQGVPFHFDASMRSYYTGSFWALLNPFALLAGVVSVAMLVLHGSIYLQIRSTGVINARAMRATLWSAAVLIVAFGAAGWLVARGIDGYRITAMPAAGVASTPLAKTVTVAAGAWLANYARPPVDDARPRSPRSPARSWRRCSRAPAGRRSRSSRARPRCPASSSPPDSRCFRSSCRRRAHPDHSLTAWDAVSSHLTLQIMFWVVLIFLPLIAVYTGWVYAVLRGKVTLEMVESEGKSGY